MEVSFRLKDTRFNFRVGAIIIKNNKLLVIKNTKANYYYTVGGRVRVNEQTFDAVRRKVKEETNLDLDVKRLLFVHENFFEEAITNEEFHQISLYYLMDDLFDESVIECHSVTEDGASETLLWISFDQLEDIILYPEFLKNEVKNLSTNIKHIVSHEKKWN